MFFQQEQSTTPSPQLIDDIVTIPDTLRQDSETLREDWGDDNSLLFDTMSNPKQQLEEVKFNTTATQQQQDGIQVSTSARVIPRLPPAVLTAAAGHLSSLANSSLTNRQTGGLLLLPFAIATRYLF